MNWLREASLRVAALPSGDRRWLLQQLRPDERARLNAGLEDLNRLTPAMLLETLSIHQASTAPAPAIATVTEPTASPDNTGEDIDFLMTATAAEIRSLVDDLPPPLLALVLERERWQWRTAIVASLPPEERDHLSLEADRLRQHVSAEFESLLLAQLARRVRIERAKRVPAAARFDALIRPTRR